MIETHADRPAPLTVAASLVAVEGLVVVLLAVLELATLSSDRLTMGLTTTAFFVAYGVGPPGGCRGRGARPCWRS